MMVSLPSGFRCFLPLGLSLALVQFVCALTFSFLYHNYIMCLLDHDNDDKNDFDDDATDDDDGNPACGCVCGTIHGGSFKVFWIQCDDCNAWYNVARKCVGFTEEEVDKKGKWSCWACSPPEDDSEDEPTKVKRRDEVDESEDDGYHSESSLEAKFVRRKKRRRTSADPPPQSCDPNRVIPNKTVVEVHREGSHLYGGMGHIVDSALDEDGDLYYTVKYIVEVSAFICFVNVLSTY